MMNHRSNHDRIFDCCFHLHDVDYDQIDDVVVADDGGDENDVYHNLMLYLYLLNQLYYLFVQILMILLMASLLNV